jgi:hypothetical protein
MDRKKTWDVIVIGGGVTGFVAATAAGRNGAKTLLIERDGALGGTMANALVSPMMSFHSLKEQVIKGLPQEVVDRLVAMHASPGHVFDTTGYVKSVTPFDNEALKLVAQRMVLESGAEILLDTWVQDAIVEGNAIRGVVVRHKGGVEELFSRVIVDSSGDADVACKAGAPWEFGRKSDQLVQPVSLMFKVGPIDVQALKLHVLDHPEDFDMSREGIDALKEQEFISINGFIGQLQKSIQSGELPLHRESVLFFSTNQPDEVLINMSRITHINPLDAWDLTRAEIQGREQMFALMDFFYKYIPGF